MYREADDEAGTSLGALKALKPDFAIYRVRAEALIALGSVTIQYKPDTKVPRAMRTLACSESTGLEPRSS